MYAMRCGDLPRCLQMEDDEQGKLTPRAREIAQNYSPEMFAARCQAAGLHTDVSSDPEHIYIRVGIERGPEQPVNRDML